MGAVLLSIVSLSLAFAPAPFPKRERADGDSSQIDLRRLQGTWKVVRLIVDGRTRRTDGYVYIVAGRQMTVRWGQINSESRISLDQPRKVMSMRWIDSGQESASDARYAIEGDKFALCYWTGLTRREPPSDLRPGNYRYFVILQRD